MGWARAPTKDFIQLCKSAKKIIYLVMASILFCSILYRNSIASKTTTLRSPHVPSQSLLKIYPLPVAPGCFCLVVECGLLPGGGARPRRFFILPFLLINSTCTFLPLRTSSQRPTPLSKPNLFDCCVYLVEKQPPTAKAWTHLSLNFCPLIRPQTNE